MSTDFNIDHAFASWNQHHNRTKILQIESTIIVLSCSNASPQPAIELVDLEKIRKIRKLNKLNLCLQIQVF